MSDFTEQLQMLIKANDTTDDYNEDDIRHNRLMSFFAYLPLLVLVPLFAANDSDFARFHANQGLLLAILELFCWIGLGCLVGIPLLGWLFRALRWVLGVVCLIFTVLGLLHAVTGKARPLPVIGRFRLLR